MRVRVRLTGLKEDAKKFTRGLESITETLKKAGRGEIVVGPRPMRPEEKAPPAHGMAIANFLRSRGGDVFEVDRRTAVTAFQAIDREVDIIFRRSMLEGRSQHTRLRKLLRIQTKRVSESIKLHIASGTTPSGRRKSRKYADKLAAMARQGADFVDQRHGLPPPWGVKTGRFIDGIRSRVSRSKRALASVYGAGFD